MKPRLLSRERSPRRGAKPPAEQPPVLLEADVVPGLEPVAAAEITRLGGRVTARAPGRLQFVWSRKAPPAAQTVLAIYTVRRFPVPRPRALLGDQHLRALLSQVTHALDLIGREACQTFMLGAAGKDTEVMQRLRAAIAAHTGLTETDHEGNLLIRVRPSAQGGWETLVRLSPRPLSTRPWRVCLVPGALQASVAQAVVQLTQPREDDVYLNLCCGSGTLLIERALAGRARRLLGCDLDPAALRCAEQNDAAYRALAGARAQPIELHNWDACALPLADGSVNVITADLPFGHSVSTAKDNQQLYPRLLREAARVCAPGGRCALVTADTAALEAALEECWESVQRLHIVLGKSNPVIVLLRRLG
ncbi:MAG: methyltransferase domain-containing protein [Anaerolineae bacterium]|nr:methyltransferase domain-containing protein [Anaerolineae bacterium]